MVSGFNASAKVVPALIPVVLAAAMEEKQDEESIVKFGPTAKSSDVSSYSLAVLKDIMKKIGSKERYCFSTARDSTNQARVMYDNIQAKGVLHQKALMGAMGIWQLMFMMQARKREKVLLRLKKQ